MSIRTPEITKSEAQQQLLYREAAARILEELDSRGFTVEDPAKTDDLVNKITDIILETVRGNTNYCVTSEKATLNDLLATLKEEDDENYPPWHPLEN
jgi:hypothetical protein